MHISIRTRKLSIGLVLLLLANMPSEISAATINLLNISSTGARNFTDTAIWDPVPVRPNIVPGSGDFPVMAFGDGINDFVYVETTTTVQRFNVGNINRGGLEIRSGVVFTAGTVGGQSNVGPGGASPGVGHLRIKSGATLNQSGLLYIGLSANGTGTVTLEPGATHTTANELAIRDGTGTYNMLGGNLTVGGFFQVARNGHGTFKQSDGVLQANRNASAQGMLLAGAAGSYGLYEISGGSLVVAATNTGVINGATAGGGAGIFRIVGSDPSVAIATNYDQRAGASFEVVIDSGGISPMNVGGNASLAGILGASFSTIPMMGQQFTIMNYTGARTGTFTAFDNLVDSPLGPNTVELSIDYGTGTNSSIVLTVVPEPASISLFGSALLVCVMLRNRLSK
jgi:hypothetical protein